MATPGQLRYLNVNTTLNSSVRVNYRQTESAFWSEYLPTVIGVRFPIYRPYSEVTSDLTYKKFPSPAMSEKKKFQEN